MLKIKKDVKVIDTFICAFYMAFCLQIFWFYLVEWALEPLFLEHPIDPFAIPSFDKGYIYLIYLWIIFYIICLVVFDKAANFYEFFKSLFIRTIFLPLIYITAILALTAFELQKQIVFFNFFCAIVTVPYFIYSIAKSFENTDQERKKMNNFNAPIPPGANIDDNVAIALEYASNNSYVDTIHWFRKQVENKGIWDYKQIDKKYEKFGNFNYGVVGRTLGIPQTVLLSAASAAQSSSNDGSWFIKNFVIDYLKSMSANPDSIKDFGLTDDPRDKVQILDGFDYFKNRYGSSDVGFYKAFTFWEDFFDRYNIKNSDTYQNLKSFHISPEHFTAWNGSTIKESIENLLAINGAEMFWEVVGGESRTANAMIVFRGDILALNHLEALSEALSYDPTDMCSHIIEKVDRFLNGQL